MKKRILHVIKTLEGGGAEAVLHNLWPALCESGRYDFELCALSSPGIFGEKLAAEGATIHCLGSKRKYDPRILLDLRRLIRERSYDVVHAHLFPELHIVALATVGLSKVRSVYTEHRSTNRRRKLGSVGRIIDKLAYDRYQHVISVNSSTHENLLAWQPGLANRSVVIKNCIGAGANPKGIQLDRERLLAQIDPSIGSDTTLMLFASRLHHQKGVDVLLSALVELKRSDYICLIAGTGEEREKLEAMATSLGLTDRVRFLGFRSDVPELLRLSHFMVLPSRYEGMPLIILEAMAAGCPIIATSVDGTAEVLRDEISALLVSPDDASMLSRAISRYLESASLRDTLAEQARLDSEDYSADNIARQLLCVYDKVLGKPPATFV